MRVISSKFIALALLFVFLPSTNLPAAEEKVIIWGVNDDASFLPKEILMLGDQLLPRYLNFEIGEPSDIEDSEIYPSILIAPENVENDGMKSWAFHTWVFGPDWWIEGRIKKKPDGIWRTRHEYMFDDYESKPRKRVFEASAIEYDESILLYIPDVKNRTIHFLSVKMEGEDMILSSEGGAIREIRFKQSAYRSVNQAEINNLNIIHYDNIVNHTNPQTIMSTILLTDSPHPVSVSLSHDGILTMNTIIRTDNQYLVISLYPHTSESPPERFLLVVDRIPFEKDFLVEPYASIFSAGPYAVIKKNDEEFLFNFNFKKLDYDFTTILPLEYRLRMTLKSMSDDKPNSGDVINVHFDKVSANSDLFSFPLIRHPTRKFHRIISGDSIFYFQK